MTETAAAMREKLFTMRMSIEEDERLAAVAQKYALNAAGLIRMLVKREFDALGLDGAQKGIAKAAPATASRARAKKK